MNISFLDFWDGFDEKHNFFIHLFRQIFGNVGYTNPEIADVIIYSCFGNKHQAFPKSGKTTKIFYTGENLRPDYNHCDFSFTFDYDSYGGKNVRIPLWLLQIDWFNHGGYTNPKYVIPLNQIDNRPPFVEREMFCSTVLNNFFPDRQEIFNKLSSYKPVNGFGKPWNNWSYGEDIKLNILENSRFNICYENTAYPGYFTEKPIHALAANTIPIYFSDQCYTKDFNPKAFIHRTDYASTEDMIQDIIKLDNDQDLYMEKLLQPFFPEKDFHKNLLEEIKNQIKKTL